MNRILIIFYFFYHRSAHLNPSPAISFVHCIDDRSDLTSPNMPKSRSMESLTNESSIALKYIPLIEEIHVSSIVSRRGYLNFLEDNGTSWMKKFIVCLIFELRRKKNKDFSRLYDVHLHSYIIMKKILWNVH